MTTSLYSSATSFHPYNERVSNSRLRVQNLKIRIDAVSVCSELLKFEKLGVLQQKAVLELFPIHHGDNLGDWLTVVADRLASIRPQLQASALTLTEACKKMDAVLEHAIQLLSIGDINPAVKHLLEIEQRFLSPCEKVADGILQLITERQCDRSAPQLVVLDLISQEIFESSLEGQKATLEVKSLPPVFYSAPELIARESWQVSQEKLFQENLGVPFTLTTVEPSLSEQPHNIIRALVAITRRLHDELLLGPELLSVFQHVASQTYASESEQSLLLAWEKDIVSECLACAIGGPAYFGATIEQYACDAAKVARAMPTDRGVSPYLRWVILSNMLRVCGFQLEADSYDQSLAGIYGPPSYALQYGNAYKEQLSLATKIPLLVRTVTETPLRSLQNATLMEIVTPFDSHAQAEAGLIAEKIGESIAKLKSDEPSKSTKGDKESFGLRADTPLGAIPTACRLAFEQACARGEAPVGHEQVTKRYLEQALSKRLLPKRVQKAPITVELAQKLARRNQKIGRLQQANGMTSARAL